MLARLVTRLFACLAFCNAPDPVRHWRDDRPVLLPDAIVHRTARVLSGGEAP